MPKPKSDKQLTSKQIVSYYLFALVFAIIIISLAYLLLESNSKIHEEKVKIHLLVNEQRLLLHKAGILSAEIINYSSQPSPPMKLIDSLKIDLRTNLTQIKNNSVMLNTLFAAIDSSLLCDLLQVNTKFTIKESTTKSHIKELETILILPIETIALNKRILLLHNLKYSSKGKISTTYEKYSYLMTEEVKDLSYISHIVYTAVIGIIVIGFLIECVFIFFPLINLLQREKREAISDTKTMQRNSNRDKLTGLYNRVLVNDTLDKLIHSTLLPSPFTICRIDIDNFMQINNIHGNSEGDKVLQEFATCLQSCLRSKDIAARIGGDEFIIIFIGNIKFMIDGVMIRILDKVNEEQELSSLNINYSFSYGTATFPQDAVDKDTLFKKAEEALLNDKESKK